jgi:hypothetical protein
MAPEKCLNCGCSIGDLETPYIWNGRVVCRSCYAKLQPKSVVRKWTVLVAACVAVVAVIVGTIWFTRQQQLSAPGASQRSLGLSESHKQMVREARRVAALLRESPGTSAASVSRYEETLTQLQILLQGMDEIPGSDANKVRKSGSDLHHSCFMCLYAYKSLNRSRESGDVTYQRARNDAAEEHQSTLESW